MPDNSENIRRAELNHRAPETPRFGWLPIDHPDDRKLVLLKEVMG